MIQGLGFIKLPPQERRSEILHATDAFAVPGGPRYTPECRITFTRVRGKHVVRAATEVEDKGIVGRLTTPALLARVRQWRTCDREEIF